MASHEHESIRHLVFVSPSTHSTRALLHAFRVGPLTHHLSLIQRFVDRVVRRIQPAHKEFRRLTGRSLTPWALDIVSRQRRKRFIADAGPFPSEGLAETFAVQGRPNARGRPFAALARAQTPHYHKRFFSIAALSVGYGLRPPPQRPQILMDLPSDASAFGRVHAFSLRLQQRKVLVGDWVGQISFQLRAPLAARVGGVRVGQVLVVGLAPCPHGDLVWPAYCWLRRELLHRTAAVVLRAAVFSKRCVIQHGREEEVGVGRELVCAGCARHARLVQRDRRTRVHKCAVTPHCAGWRHSDEARGLGRIRRAHGVERRRRPRPSCSHQRAAAVAGTS